MLLAACSVGSVGDTADDDGGGGGDGMGGGQSFNAMVKPLVTRCAGAGCHATGSNQPDLTDYSKLVDKYKSKPATANILITKAADGALHNGVAYLSTSDKATITTWIDSLP